MFAGFNGGGIAGDVADEAVLLGFSNQSLVYELGKFHDSELGEGSREGGFVGNLPRVIPSAEAAELVVALEGVEELTGERESVDGFGDEGVGDGEAVFGGPADPASAGGDESGERDHLQCGDESLGGGG